MNITDVQSNFAFASNLSIEFSEHILAVGPIP